MGKIEILCDNCGKSVQKEARHVRSALANCRRMFCNTSCSASFNNKRHPKRTKKEFLCSCGNRMSKESSQCIVCYRESMVAEDSVTMGELFSRYGKGRHVAASVYALINGRARSRHSKPSTCDNCTWAYNLVWHHVKPMSEFGPEATVAEVNDRKNLLCLCRNCHAYMHEFGELPSW